MISQNQNNGQSHRELTDDISKGELSNTDVCVFDDVYEPAEDAFVLVEAAHGIVSEDMDVLEVGTGSGYVSVMIKPHVRCLIATDINPNACKCARKNGIDVIRTDLFSGIKKKFHLVMFNTPYLPTEDDEKMDGWINRAYDGGKSGTDITSRFIENVKEILTDSGSILIVTSSLAGVDDVSNMMQEAGFSANVVASKHYFFEDIVVLHGTIT
ncbi:MAG: methyltransferase [Methanosarcinales archaeon]|nr:methyltransferase [Methanosarcinales archaeon]